MNILFLQNMHDAIGGITNVNLALASAFADDENNVSIYSIRNGGYSATIDYPKKVHTKLINDKDEWGCPRYSKCVELLKQGHVVEAIKHLNRRVMYNKGMKNDFEQMKKEIECLNPDVIIVSHYELFDAIPEAYYKRTISHYHTNFQQLVSFEGQKRIFNAYKDKLGKFVWLSNHTSDDAIAYGITNSMSIYNPVSFSSDTVSDLNKHKAVFIGRFSKEKRLDVMVRLFNELIEEKQMNEWSLDLYGVNAEDQALLDLIEKSPNVSFLGATNKVKEVLQNYSMFLLTSSFEGFPLVVIEANECGVPCVVFNFGETADEVVMNDKTGYLVEQDNEKEYKEALYKLMKDDEKRKQMGMEAKTFAKQFSIDEIKERWYSLFNELR